MKGERGEMATIGRKGQKKKAEKRKFYLPFQIKVSLQG